MLLCLQTTTCTSFQTLSTTTITQQPQRELPASSVYEIFRLSSVENTRGQFIPGTKNTNCILLLNCSLLAAGEIHLSWRSWVDPSQSNMLPKQEAAIVHMNSCDTHSDSVSGRADRNQVDRKPGTDSYRGSAGAAWSRRTDNPTCWNRWHRMIGRLQGRQGRKGNQWLSVTSKINFHFTRELQDCLSQSSLL